MTSLQINQRTTPASGEAIELAFAEIATLAQEALRRCHEDEAGDLATQLALGRIGLLADRFTGYAQRGSADAWLLSPAMRQALGQVEAAAG